MIPNTRKSPQQSFALLLTMVKHVCHSLYSTNVDQQKGTAFCLPFLMMWGHKGCNHSFTQQRKQIPCKLIWFCCIPHGMTYSNSFLHIHIPVYKHTCTHTHTRNKENFCIKITTSTVYCPFCKQTLFTVH